MTTQLEIRLILNANPAWVRNDLGPLEKLTASVEKHGIRIPVLVAPDFLVIDGARRIVAAQSLGHEAVPIQMCNTWDDVKKNFKPTSTDTYPMEWPELIDLWYRVLNPIYREVQRKQALQTRRSGVANKRELYSGFVAEVAEIYNEHPSIIKTIRDYVRRVERRQNEYPFFTAEVTKWYPTGEVARDLKLIRGLKMVMENIFNGLMSEDEALDVFQRRMSGEKIPHSRRARPKKVVSTTPRNLEALTTFAEMLQNLATEAEDFHVFAVSATEAEQVAVKLRRSLTEINRMKRRLTQVAVIPGDSKEKR